MWQNIIIFIIIAACLFFIGRRIRRQLKGSTGGGCGCSGGCGGCDAPAAKTKDCETKKPPSLP
jgi:hypothetical protein